MQIGAHVDSTDPIAEARARQADISQFFLGDPQGWKRPVVNYRPEGGTSEPAGDDDGNGEDKTDNAERAAALRTAAEQTGVGLYVHAPYVLNVATTNNRIRIPSRKLLQQTVDLAAEIGARGVIVHGGHVTKGDDPEIGFDNWRKCIDRLELNCPVLIENTAGGDHAMARYLDRIARLWDAVGAADGGDTVGFCLDTCHFHAAGEELSGVVDRVRGITGRVDLVHVNDSQDAFGSGRDRHANLGSGEIALQDIATVVRAAGAPCVVETPNGVEGQAADVAWLRDNVTS